MSYPFNREIETATLSALSGIVVPGGGKDERTREFELAVVQEFFFSSFFFSSLYFVLLSFVLIAILARVQSFNSTLFLL